MTRTNPDGLKRLIEELSARPLGTEGPRRRRLPKATSRFIRQEMEACRDEGQTVRHCVTLAYWKAKRRRLL
jgi:hypothetical protein